jgi:hypothetical protein
MANLAALETFQHLIENVVVQARQLGAPGRDDSA